MFTGMGFSLTKPQSVGSLFRAGDKGFFLDPSVLSKLDQLSTGGQPVTGPGQPVGLIRRAAGSVDAAQAVLAARPTLGRHPKSGRRNLAVGAQAVDGAGGHWPASTTRSGVTASRVGSGLEGGIPYVDIRFHGTSTTEMLQDFFFTAQPIYPSAVGNIWTMRATARVIAGAMPASSTIRTRLSYYTGASWAAGPASPFVADLSSDTELLVTNTHSSAALDGVRPSIIFGGGGGGVAVDVTIRLKGVQMEAGAVATPLQHNLGAYDVTEAGIESVWYLGLDGIDDFLSTTAIPWATDEVTVVAAIHKASDAASANVTSFGDYSFTHGGWRLSAPRVAGESSFSAYSGGGENITITSTGDVAPVTAVVAMQASTQGRILRLRRNGVQVAQNLGDQGSLPTYFNGASAPLAIGRWYGIDFFNGRIYGLFAINRLLTASELVQVEQEIARKCGIILS